MKKFLSLVIVLFSICVAGYSQPANDNCTGATLISIPSTGSACVTGTSAGATSTTWSTGPVCGQTTWTDDVWYTFVSTGTFNVITVSPAGSPAAQQIGIAVFTGGCTNFTVSQTSYTPLFSHH